MTFTPTRRSVRLGVCATLAALCACATGPAAARATFGVGTSISMPAAVTVGDADLAGPSVVLQNANNGGTGTNSVCNAGDPGPPCDIVPPERGVLVLLACGVTNAGTCSPGEADPGVMTITPGSAMGRFGSQCSSMPFTASIIDPATGQYRLAPPAGVHVVIAEGASCVVDFHIDVLKSPTKDATPATATVETAQTTEHGQYNGTTVPPPSGAFNGHARVASGPVTVAKAQPTIATAASADISLGGAGTLTDSATVMGLANPQPGATVTFNLYGPNDVTCSGGLAFTSTVAFPVGANAVASDPFTPTVAGTYRWRATFSGDANNSPVTGTCNAPGESTVVASAPVPPPVSPPVAPPAPPPVAPPPVAPPAAPARPTLTTTASPGVALGAGTLTDTATIGGRVDPLAGSTVEFRLYGPGDATCSATPVFTSTAAFSPAGTATSGPFAPAAAGTYRWRAFYSGDANNEAASGACNDPGESVTVAPAATRILSAAFVSRPRVDRPAILLVRAVDPARPIRGMRVSFGEARGGKVLSACAQPALAASATPVRLRVPYTFRRPGRHLVAVSVLTGGCDSAASGAATSVPVTVAPRSGRGPARTARTTCADGNLTPTASALSLRRVAAAVMCLVNVERRKRGLPTFRPSPALRIAASGHSKEMVRKHYCEHERAGSPSLKLRLRRAGYRGPTFAENIACLQDGTPAVTVRAWMNSPPHRANILVRRLRFAGVGVAIGTNFKPYAFGSSYTMNYGGTVR